MKTSHRRYWVFFLLFLFNGIAYLDRVNMSVAGKPIANEFGLSPIALGYLFSSFLWAYVLMMLPGGRLIDRWGTHVIASVATAEAARRVSVEEENMARSKSPNDKVEHVAGNGLLHRRALLGRSIALAGALGAGSLNAKEAAADPLTEAPLGSADGRPDSRLPNAVSVR